MSRDTYSLKIMSRLINIAIAASPGVLKIAILILAGISMGPESRGLLASDLAAISFILIITSVSTGTHIIKHFPNANTEQRKIKLIDATKYSIYTTILFTPALAYINYTAEFTQNLPFILLSIFTANLYWLVRHFHLANSDSSKAAKLEVSVWLLTLTLLAASFLINAASVTWVLTSTSIAYFAAALPTILRNKTNKKDASWQTLPRESAELALNNIISGGIITLIPIYIASHHSHELAGTAALALSAAAFLQVLARGILIPELPKLAGLASSNKSAMEHERNKTQNRINNTIFAGTIPIILATTATEIATKATANTTTTFSIIALCTIATAIPLLSAVDSFLAIFQSQTKQILTINVGNFIATIAIGAIITLSTPNHIDDFKVITTLSIICIGFMARNRFTKKLVETPPSKNEI